MAKTRRTFRNWTWTWNNYNEEVENYLRDIVGPQCKYLIYGREEAPTTGTKHLQGYLVYKSATTENVLRTLLTHPTLVPRSSAHVESSNGTTVQNIEYCCKDKPPVAVVEIGSRPKTKQEQGELGKRAYRECIAYAENGKLEEIKDKYPRLYVRYSAAWKRIRLDATCLGSVSIPTTNYWL